MWPGWPSLTPLPTSSCASGCPMGQGRMTNYCPGMSGRHCCPHPLLEPPMSCHFVGCPLRASPLPLSSTKALWVHSGFCSDLGPEVGGGLGRGTQRGVGWRQVGVVGENRQRKGVEGSEARGMGELRTVTSWAGRGVLQEEKMGESQRVGQGSPCSFLSLSPVPHPGHASAPPHRSLWVAVGRPLMT